MNSLVIGSEDILKERKQMKHIIPITLAFSLLSTAMAADLPKDNFTSSPKVFPGGKTESMIHHKAEYERTLASPTKEWYDAIPVVEEPQEAFMEPRRKKAPPATEEIVPRRAGTIAKPPRAPVVTIPTAKKSVPALKLPQHALVEEDSGIFGPMVGGLIDIPSPKGSPLSKEESETIYGGE